MDWKGLDGLFYELSALERSAPDIVDACVEAGAEEVVTAWKEAIERNGHVRTGEMLRSVGIKPAKKSQDRTAVDIYPLGKDSRGVRNAEKAYINHYGTSKKRGSHFVDEAERNAEEPATQAMIEAFDRYYLGGL